MRIKMGVYFTALGITKSFMVSSLGSSICSSISNIRCLVLADLIKLAQLGAEEAPSDLRRHRLRPAALHPMRLISHHLRTTIIECLSPQLVPILLALCSPRDICCYHLSCPRSLLAPGFAPCPQTRSSHTRTCQSTQRRRISIWLCMTKSTTPPAS